MNQLMFHVSQPDISGDTKRDHRPFFKCDAVLAIPNVVMAPALDEVQQIVNKAAQMIISVSKVSEQSKHLQTKSLFLMLKTLSEQNTHHRITMHALLVKTTHFIVKTLECSRSKRLTPEHKALNCQNTEHLLSRH